MKAGDVAGAVEHFEQAVEVRSTDFQGQYWLGVNLLQAGDAIRAQAPLEQALALRPHDPVWRPRIADAVAESYYQQDQKRKASCLFGQHGGDLQSAIVRFHA